jgi:hypothetical protein
VRGCLLLPLAVEILFQLGRIQFHLGTVLGDIDLGGPEDGVGDQAAEVFVAPILVGVAAGEAEAPAAVLPFMRPGDDLVTARVMKESCVKCHNTHPESTKTNWKVGEVRGVVEIIRPLENDVAKTEEGLRDTFTLIAVISISLLAGLSALVVGLGLWGRSYAQSGSGRG